MTQTGTTTTGHCTGTQALSDAEALATLAAEGATQEADWYAKGQWYGRKMCAVCGGSVLRTRNGALRKHKPRSNRI
jgi:hypothetical protein